MDGQMVAHQYNGISLNYKTVGKITEQKVDYQ